MQIDCLLLLDAVLTLYFFFVCAFRVEGSYIANRVSNKLTPVHERIYCCRSGSAADTQAISDYVHFYLDMHA